MTADWLVSGAVLFRNQDANTDQNTNKELEFSVSATHVYPQPFQVGESGDPWTTSATLSRSTTRFDEPNVLVDPNVGRRDREYEFTLFTAVPVTDAVTFIGTLQRNVTESTLPNFEFVNSSVTLGASWRF